MSIFQPNNQIEKYKNENYQFINADLREFKNCKRVVEGQDIIFHIAVKGSPKRAMEQPDYFVPMLQFNMDEDSTRGC